MNPGDKVMCRGELAVLLKLPRSAGRAKARALVRMLLGEQWVPVDELKPVEQKDMVK